MMGGDVKKFCTKDIFLLSTLYLDASRLFCPISVVYHLELRIAITFTESTVGY